VPHGAESLEDHLGLWIEGDDQLRMIITSKFPKQGILSKPGIGKGIRPSIKRLPAFFHIINSDNQVLSLKIGQKSQTTRSGTDNTFNAIGQAHLSPSRIDHYSFAGMGSYRDAEEGSKNNHHHKKLPHFSLQKKATEISGFLRGSQTPSWLN
jgi:hypothetical protein